MRRKKDPQTQPADPAKFWPVPGVDGEPYSPLVQEALDLVAKETLRRKRAECTHTNRKFITGSGQDRYGSRIRYRRACRDCHLVVTCEHPEDAQHRERVKHIGNGSFIEFLECRCGETIAKRVELKRRTEIYGVPYERREEPTRRTGTAWLKTEEEERREARTDRMVSRQIRRASTQLPLMITTDGDPGTKPGALERAITRAVERDLQESTQVDRVRRVSNWDKEVRRVQELLNEAQRYSEGAMARSTETYILRKANGEAVLHVTEDRAPDLSWVRTMNGKQQLR
jgi:hypothetical protein